MYNLSCLSLDIGKYQEKVQLSSRRHHLPAWRCHGTLQYCTVAPHTHITSRSRLSRLLELSGPGQWSKTDTYACCIRHSRGIRSHPTIFHFAISPLRRQPSSSNPEPAKRYQFGGQNRDLRIPIMPFQGWQREKGIGTRQPEVNGRDCEMHII